jgi:hypothetical protein
MLGIPNRPFSTEPLTGFMLPDGFFEASLGTQTLNAHFQNLGASAVNVQLYLESTSHPAFIFTQQTFDVNGLAGGAVYLGSWMVDVSGVPPGIYLVSFIAQIGMAQTRIIKKVFVTKVTYDAASNTLGIAAPEGNLGVVLTSVLGPKGGCGGTGGAGCGCGCAGSGIKNGRNASGQLVPASLSKPSADDAASLITQLKPLMQTLINDPSQASCSPFYLLKDGILTATYDPPFAGQYGDLPYQDPWWKTLLLILAVILAIAAFVVASVASGGTVAVAGATIIASCCATTAGSILFGSLAAGATASGGAAGLSDARDPFRRGEDHTLPAPGELTTSETVKFSLSYPEALTLGKPFAVQADWHYTRTTTGNSYTYAVSETNTNIHVLESYDITCPNIVRTYERQPFLIKGRFYVGGNKIKGGEFFRGSQLYVQCFLVGIGPLQGRYIRFLMQDSGIHPDIDANDGTYTGIHYFAPEDHGFWQIYVIAQDVNDAQPDLTPEQAAQIIGGFVRTHQLTIDFQGGTCPHVPDGEVHVLSELGS